MKRLFFIVLLVIPISVTAALAPHEIYQRTCGSDPNCFMCMGMINDGYGAVFDKCENYGIFNKNSRKVERNGNTIIGLYDPSIKQNACTIVSTQKQCDITYDTTYTPDIVKFEYVWGGSLGFGSKKDIEKKGDGFYLQMDDKFNLTAKEIVNDRGAEYTINLLDLIRGSIKSDINIELLKGATMSFKYVTIRWEGSVIKSAVDDERKNVFPLTPFGETTLHHRGIRKNPLISIDVPVVYKHQTVSATCPFNSSLPCVSSDGGKSYFCSSSECGVFVDDGIKPDDNKVMDDTPKTEIVKDNETCKNDMQLYLFPGNKLECRHKKDAWYSSDVSAPNQCIVDSSLDNVAKDNIKGGINKFFSVIDPIGIATLLQKLLINTIIENIADKPTSEEQKLSLSRGIYAEDGACIKVGEYCSDFGMESNHGVIGGKAYDNSYCERRSSIYCCYDSPIAKAFNVAARQQLPQMINWGRNLGFVDKVTKFWAPAPNCRGLTVDELAKVNINSPEFKDDMKQYVNDVLLPTLSKDDGMLDPTRLTDMQQKMQDDMMKFYNK